MTVRELIQQLQNFDMDATVLIPNKDYCDTHRAPHVWESSSWWRETQSGNFIEDDHAGTLKGLYL